jgi:hypothetical protein
MSQYRQSQPYSFFGYPQSYTGGYDVAQPQAYAAPATRYEEIMAQPVMGGGGRVGDREGPSAWSQLTPAERAAYYKERPIEGSLALGAQDLLGDFTLMGQAAKYFGPDGWYDSRLEKMGVNPTISLDTQNQLAGEAMQRALYPTGGFVAKTPEQAAAESAAAAQAAQAVQAAAQAAAQAQAVAAAQAEAARQPIVESPGGRGGGYSQRGGESVGGYSGADASRAASGQFGMGPGTAGFNSGGGSTNYKGGPIFMKNLIGPDPEGPDDGYASLKDGEYVINDKAVKKYGIELMNAINSGKISKGKLRGLLEM